MDKLIIALCACAVALVVFLLWAILRELWREIKRHSDHWRLGR